MTPVEPANSPIRVRIAANFTIEPIEEFLSYWLSQLGIPAEIQFAPYNQIFQQLLEGGLLRTNRAGINVVALDLDAWLVEGPLEAAKTQLNKTVEDLLGVFRSSGAQGAGGAVVLFPPAPAQNERAGEVAAARSRLVEAIKSIAGWTAVDLVPAVALYDVGESRDPFTDELGNIPFTEEMYVAAATATARWIRSVRTRARKVIVLDCDNTLWQGVCGEGPVQVTEPYRKLHEFMLRQRDEGVLLAVASKNNEDDVMAVLNSDESVLKPEHFTAWQINWQAKSENLNTLSEELGLAQNSFLFLDDSPLECLEVRNACPEILTVTLPHDPQAIASFLEHFWAFDRPAATEEDRTRASMYEVEKQRVELSRRALTREEFLASLQIEIRTSKATDGDWPRVSQLTQRTTQFNMAGVVYSLQSLTDKVATAGTECWTVRVKDVFGDYGLVGAVIFETANDSLVVDTFLLSCRALGRGVEDRMLEDLKRWAMERGLERVVVRFIPTVRNRPAMEFLSRVAAVPGDANEPLDCVISASGSAAEWKPSDKPARAISDEKPTRSPSEVVLDEGEVLLRIAHELQSVETIVAAMRNQKKRRPVDAGQFVVPKPGIEEGLARIWSDCLAVDPIGANDNFFDFGGQSLIATRILTRARAEFGVEMGLTNLFERPTVSQMATYIAEMMAQAASGAVGAHKEGN